MKEEVKKEVKSFTEIACQTEEESKDKQEKKESKVNDESK